MKGGKPNEYKLHNDDRRYLKEIATNGQLIQRVANRARALWALDRGERIAEIVHWLGSESLQPLVFMAALCGTWRGGHL